MAAGRTHQLRRHMAMLGHPILGDRRYHYGWAAQHERLAKAGPSIQAASQPHSNGSAGTGTGADLRPTADANEHDAPQAAAGLLPSNGCVYTTTAQPGAAQAAELKRPEAELDFLQQGAGSVDAQACSHTSAHLVGRSTRSGTSAGGLCLWAVQVDLQHPITLDELRVCISEPEQYAALRAAHEARTVK